MSAHFEEHAFSSPNRHRKHNSSSLKCKHIILIILFAVFVIRFKHFGQKASFWFLLSVLLFHRQTQARFYFDNVVIIGNHDNTLYFRVCLNIQSPPHTLTRARLVQWGVNVLVKLIQSDCSFSVAARWGNNSNNNNNKTQTQDINRDINVQHDHFCFVLTCVKYLKLQTLPRLTCRPTIRE